MEKYRIKLFGLGNEFAIGSIPKETWDYIQKTFDGSESDYLDALDAGDVPEKYRLAENSNSMRWCDDLWHDDGCFSDAFCIEIKKLNDDGSEGDRVFVCDCDETQDNGIETEIGCHEIDNSIPYLCTFATLDKGTWLTGDFEIDGEFDPKKLKIICCGVNYNNHEDCSQHVALFEYDGEEIPCEFEETWSKWINDEVCFIEVKQLPVEKEKA